MERALTTWKELPLTYRTSVYIGAAVLGIAIIVALTRTKPASCPVPTPQQRAPT